MSKEWIDALAEDLKQQGREAAEAYGRERHRAGIVTAQAPAFFTVLAQCLQDDFAAIRARLQGSVVASEITAERTSETELRLTRARFPWFDATLQHAGDTLILDYAKDRSTAPPLAPSRQSARFNFEVDAQDRLSVMEAFTDIPRSFITPEDICRHIVELLFKF